MTLVISDLTSAQSMTELSTYQSNHICGGTSPWSFNFGFSWNSTTVTTSSLTGSAIGPSSVVIQATDDANVDVTLGG